METNIKEASEGGGGEETHGVEERTNGEGGGKGGEKENVYHSMD